MKKILAWVLLLVMLLGMLAGCKKPVDEPDTPPVTEPSADVEQPSNDEPTAPQGPTAEEAMTYLRAIYKDTEEPTPTPVNYDRYGIVRIAGVPFTVVWTVDVGEDLIKIVVNEDSSVTIDVNETCEVATPYSLTATITDEFGGTASHSWDMVLPAAADMTEIVKTAYQLAPGEALPYESTLRGEISAINTVYSAEYKNITVTIKVAGVENMPIECYRLKGEGIEDLAVGNIITVTGTLKNYNGKIEFDAGCTMDAWEKGNAVEAPTDIGTILKAAYNLGDGQTLPYPVTMTGTVTGIDSPYDPNYGNISVIMVADGYSQYPMIAFRLKGNGVEKIAINDKITVTGIVKNYKGKIEFDAGCQLLNRVSGGGVAQGPSSDANKILNDANQLNPGEKLPYKATLTGEIVSVDQAYDPGYGNVTVTIKVNGQKIQCYRLKGDGADLIRVTDKITVSGIIENYNGKLEFGSGCTLDSWTMGSRVVPVDLGPLKAETAYILQMKQATLGKVLYFNGQKDGSYLATSENVNDAIKLYVEQTEGKGVRFYFMSGETKTYLELESYTNKDGKLRARPALVTSPSVYWTYESSAKVYTVELSGTKYFLGTYNDFSTISSSSTYYITDGNAANVGKTQFVAEFVLPSEAGGDIGGETPDTPTTSFGTYTTAPEVGVAYKLGLDQTAKNETYYFTGVMSGYYGATETDFTKGVDVYLETAEGGYYLSFTDADGVKQYIYIVASGTHMNFTFSAENKSVFVFDATLNSLYTTVDGNVYYMGTYSNYVTVGTTAESKVETSYVTHLYTSANGGTETPDEPEIPEIPETAFGTYTTAPEVGVAYKLGLDQTAKNETYYFTGVMSGYYGATETDFTKGVDVYLETAEGGYYLYFTDADGAKQYIYIVASGTHMNFTFSAENKSVFVFDTTLNSLYTTVDGAVYYMGTYSNYVTVGTTAESKVETSYVTHLYTSANSGTETPEDPCANGHTEVIDAAIPATCTTTGKTEGKHCSVCNTVLVAQTEVAALGHTEVIDAAVPATCTETGLTEGKHCSVCNEVLVAQTEVAALGHTEVIDAAVSATCTETGLTEGKHCSVCNEVLVAQKEVAALGHTAVVDAAISATCTTTGKTEGKHCSVCQEILVAQKEVAALGHTEVIDAAVAATCTTAGKTEGKHCSVCQEILVAQKDVAALGHTEVIDAGVAATCTATGLTEGKHCSVCNAVLTAQNVIPALGHTDSNNDYQCDVCGADLCEVHTEVSIPSKAATCTETGLTEGKKCSVCGEIITIQTVIPALGHTEVIDAAVAATCTTAGKTEGKHCSVCNEVLVAQTEISKLGHTAVVDAAVEPTCTTDGKTEGKHCSVCNAVIVAQQTITAKGHKEVIDAAVAATCTAAGKTEGKHCSVCNTVLVAQTEVAALGHTAVVDAAVKPTCTETGLTEGKHCSVCNTVLVAQTEVAALGHTEVVDAAVAPTCATAGKTEGKHCSVCNTVIVAQTEVAPLGHKYTDNFCTVCGDPAIDVAYKWAFDQTQDGATYYFKGAMEGYYGATTTNFDEGVDVKLEAAEGGYYITFVDATGAKKYINVVVSGTHFNFTIADAAETVYTYSTEHKTMLTNIDGTDLFFGTYGSNKTFGASKLSYISTSYVAYFCTEAPEKPETPDTPDTPVTPDNTKYGTYTTSPEVGVAYKLGLDQTINEATYYFTGVMSGYYGATETDYAQAIDVYLENADGGYYLYFTDADGAKQYVYIVASGTHMNFTFSATDKSVFVYDTTLHSLHTTVNDTIYYMGTYGSYVTVGTTAEDKVSTSYVTHLYTAAATGSTTPDTPDTPDVPATGNYVDLTVDSLGLASQAYTAGTATVSGVGFEWIQLGNYGNGIQMRDKDGNTSILWNTTATTSKITKIELTFDSVKSTYDNPDAVIFSFGNAADNLTYTTKLSTTAGQKTYTIETDGGDYTFFKIEHDLSFSMYWASIKICYEGDGSNTPSTPETPDTPDTPDVPATGNCVTLTVDSLGLASQAYTAGTATVSGVGFEWIQLGNYGNGIQMRDKDGNTSILWSTSATPSKITKIELTFNSAKSTYDNSDAVIFSFGNAADNLTYTTKLSTTAGQKTYTIETDGGDYTFFKIEHDLSFSMYWDSIVIYYEG